MRRLHGLLAIAVLLVHGSSMSGDIKRYQRKLATFSPDSDVPVRKKGESLAELFR